MDLEYFCNQIKDELHGAKNYVQKAIEIKPMNAEWSKKFLQMSEAEKEHALNLYTMMNTYADKLQNNYRETPSYMKAQIESIRKDFDNCMEQYVLFYSAYQKL